MGCRLCHECGVRWATSGPRYKACVCTDHDVGREMVVRDALIPLAPRWDDNHATRHEGYNGSTYRRLASGGDYLYVGLGKLMPWFARP